MSRNPTGASGAAPLDEEQLTKLRALVKPGGGGIALADFEGVGGPAMARALAGLPVRPATRALIRLGLERLAASSSDPIPQALEGVLDEMTLKAQPKPVCPRCLDIEPGTPGDPLWATKTGLVRPHLCAACEKAVKP